MCDETVISRRKWTNMSTFWVCVRTSHNPLIPWKSKCWTLVWPTIHTPYYRSPSICWMSRTLTPISSFTSNWCPFCTPLSPSFRFYKEIKSENIIVCVWLISLSLSCGFWLTLFSWLLVPINLSSPSLRFGECGATISLNAVWYLSLPLPLLVL